MHNIFIKTLTKF